MQYCSYYRARVVKRSIWFVTGCLRNSENLVLERTLEGTHDVLEFFVTSDREAEFVSLFEDFKRQKIVLWLKKMPNRLARERLLSQC